MKSNSGRGQRDLKVKVKTARGRKLSSTRWLERQLNDPYVARARREGFRGRAAYKVLELDDRFRFLVPGARVVDLGCAPGGWCQVAVPRINALGQRSGKAVGRIIGVDLQEVDPIPGAELHVLDFLEDGADGLDREAPNDPCQGDLRAMEIREALTFDDVVASCSREIERAAATHRRYPHVRVTTHHRR
jgi:23S rRNA U2552 (ribose-2'-O)-methylase RlmE/FtsJ